jgi:hypothetical protein
MLMVATMLRRRDRRDLRRLELGERIEVAHLRDRQLAMLAAR